MWRSPDFNEDLKPPPLLYHYTNPDAFRSIVAGGACLQATHHRYVNDAGEVAFGIDVARQTLSEIANTMDPEVYRKADAQIAELLDRDSYIACLSSKPNVLSQWRAYAANGTGYCIGFRARERLEGYGDEEAFWSNHLVGCLYGREVVAERLRERFAHAINHMAKSTSEDRVDILVSFLLRIANRYAHVAKHEHFQEEAEWRFVVDAPQYDVKYCTTALGLTPYLYTEELTIEEVWVGPGAGPSPEIAKRTAMQFLARHGMTNAKVEHWASPFRGR